MASIPGLYFVIAGDDRARFVRPDADDRLHTVGCVALADLPEADADAAGVRGPPGPEGNRFVPRLAGRISEDFAADLFTHLVVAAPPPVLQELLSLVDVPATACLLGSLGRDLMSVPDLELWPHLLPWIQIGEMDCTSDVPLQRW